VDCMPQKTFLSLTWFRVRDSRDLHIALTSPTATLTIARPQRTGPPRVAARWILLAEPPRSSAYTWR
jgi:hypothetical protein